MAPDGLTWTYHLRKGAKFSDGHPITAEDVLFSFQVIYDKTLHPSAQDLLIMGGKPFEVTAPDPYTVVIKTPSPNAALVECVANVPDHAEARARGGVQERGFRVRLQRQHTARQDRDQRSVAYRAVRAGREDGARAQSRTTSASTRRIDVSRISTRSCS